MAPARKRGLSTSLSSRRGRGRLATTTHLNSSLFEESTRPTPLVRLAAKCRLLHSHPVIIGRNAARFSLSFSSLIFDSINLWNTASKPDVAPFRGLPGSQFTVFSWARKGRASRRVEQIRRCCPAAASRAPVRSLPPSLTPAPNVVDRD